MHTILALLGSMIIVGASIPYIIATLKGEAKPNIVTWFTWAVLNIITAFAAASDGAMQTAIFASAGAFSTLFITVAGLHRSGVKSYTIFDIVCLCLAGVGIVLWRLTSEPAAAIAMNLLADFFGLLPTLRHAWKAPQHENWQAFALSALGSSLTLASLTSHTFVSVAYPLWFLVTDTTLVSLILGRRRKVVPQATAEAEPAQSM